MFDGPRVSAPRQLRLRSRSISCRCNRRKATTLCEKSLRCYDSAGESARIARPAAIFARSWMVQEGETGQGESVSAILTDRVARPGEFPLSRPDFHGQG